MDYLVHNIAINLNHIRKAKGMSLDVVAEQTGVSKSMLAAIEKGAANPSIGVLGKIMSYMHYGIKSDIVSMAKALGGGMPIGAICAREEVAKAFTMGSHGTTFGGNPVCCAGAINVLNRLDENMLAGVEERSAYIKRELTGAKGVLGVSGLGLMIGIQTEKNASDIIAACREKGVLVIKAKDKLRLLPALNIPMEQLKKAVAVIKACCA